MSLTPAGNNDQQVEVGAVVPKNILRVKENLKDIETTDFEFSEEKQTHGNVSFTQITFDKDTKLHISGYLLRKKDKEPRK